MTRDDLDATWWKDGRRTSANPCCSAVEPCRVQRTDPWAVCRTCVTAMLAAAPRPPESVLAQSDLCEVDKDKIDEALEKLNRITAGWVDRGGKWHILARSELQDLANEAMVVLLQIKQSDRVAVLEAEVADLREVLEPFKFDGLEELPNEMRIFHDLPRPTVADVCRARAALRSSQEPR